MARQPLDRQNLMPDWRDHLTDDERIRLDDIDSERDALTAERLRIYDRAKKRAQRFTPDG